MEKILNKSIILKKGINPKFYEEIAWNKQAYVCGIDEVGRGCLAGPIVTAAVILFPFSFHSLLRDSKILTEKKRVEAAKWIIKNSWFSYGIVDHREIDRINIYQATKIAMKQAIYNIYSILPNSAYPELIVIDAMPLQVPFLPLSPEILSFPYGESRSISIAAASILAKVKRDELVSRMEHSFPSYTLSTHKGYATHKHQQEISLQGASLLHRTTFLKKFTIEKRNLDESSSNKQTLLFC